MDDSCVVCAETLELVAYGQCGHCEVCSTCIARLRFICDDHSCCLCKSNSNMIFVTKRVEKAIKEKTCNALLLKVSYRDYRSRKNVQAGWLGCNGQSPQ